MNAYVAEPQSICPMLSKAKHGDVGYAASEQSIREAARGGDGRASSNPLPQRGTEQVFHNHKG